MKINMVTSEICFRNIYIKQEADRISKKKLKEGSKDMIIVSSNTFLIITFLTSHSNNIHCWHTFDPYPLENDFKYTHSEIKFKKYINNLNVLLHHCFCTDVIKSICFDKCSLM